MKKYIKTYTLMFIGMTIMLMTSSCKKADQPTVCILPYTDSIFAGDMDTFSSCSRDAKSFVWDFGDGTTATTATATHTYATSGIYTVTLTTSNGQSSASRSFSVTVQPLGGKWIFQGNTFKATTCYGSGSGLYAYTLYNSLTGSSNLRFSFYNYLPTTSGTYTVVQGNSYPYNPTEVSVQLLSSGSFNSIYYYPYWTGSAQTVNVTVVNHKVSISGVLGMYNYNNPIDSGLLDFSVIQLQ